MIMFFELLERYRSASFGMDYSMRYVAILILTIHTPFSERACPHQWFELLTYLFKVSLILNLKKLFSCFL